MTLVDINDFNQEKQCIFKGECYSVRDNGAVLRHPPEGKRARPNDNKWTFGKENAANAYLHISNVRIHRIVATAFHGEPPDPHYVVDHIDTNCRNNRPENLRWLTRLENALKNPATRKKIIYHCGSIEAFLKNPSILNNLQSEPNFKWMRSVTLEEAENCKKRMSLWADTESKPSRPTSADKHKSSFGERAFKPIQKWEVGLAGEPGLELASTSRCATYMWGADYFPCCPQSFGDDPIDDYFQIIKKGAILAYSENDAYCPKHKVIESVILKKKQSILVMCKTSDDQWSIIGIMLDQRSHPKHFVHFNLGSYSSKDEVEKEFPVKKNLEHFWDEGYNNGYSDQTSSTDPPLKKYIPYNDPCMYLVFCDECDHYTIMNPRLETPTHDIDASGLSAGTCEKCGENHILAKASPNLITLGFEGIERFDDLIEKAAMLYNVHSKVIPVSREKYEATPHYDIKILSKNIIEKTCYTGAPNKDQLTKLLEQVEDENISGDTRAINIIKTAITYIQ